jgi:hypothetical protein
MTIEDDLKNLEDFNKLRKKFKELQGKVDGIAKASLSDRIAALEYYHKANVPTDIFQHVEHVLTGHPSDKKLPGAYREAYKILDKAVKGRDETVNDEKLLLNIIEKYVDTFLEAEFGKEYTDRMQMLKEEGADAEAIRDEKARMFGRFYHDEQGNPINILKKNYIKKLKGKRKKDIVSELQNIVEGQTKIYAGYLMGDLTGELIIDEERSKFAKHIKKKFDKKYDPDAPYSSKHVNKLKGEYGLLITKDEPELKKRGYKPK